MAYLPFLKAFWPHSMNVSFAERLRASLGGAIGIALTALISIGIAGGAHLSPWLVAPLGASAVLVFAVPSSPLAQPWSVIGGNTVSAVAGIVMCNLIPDPVLAAASAVGLAIGGMFVLRCLHPPGGAMALLVVLTHTKAPVFILFPAFTNSLLLVGVGLAWNNLTRHTYPHITSSPPAVSGLLRITEADLTAALSEEDEVMDIARDDLARLLDRSEQLAWTRLAAGRTCANVMTAPVHIVRNGTSVKVAWTLMERYDIKALPVVDRQRRVLGLLTRADLKIARRGGHIQEAAAEWMRKEFMTVHGDAALDHLVPLFMRGDRRHVVVLDEAGRLAGIISASDMMRAIYHAA